MDQSLSKEMITRHAAAMAPPPAALEALRLTQAAPAFAARIVRLGEQYPGLIAAILRAAGLPPGSPELREAILRMDIALLRKTLFTHLAAAMLPGDPARDDESRREWAHARLTASLAESLARRVNNAYKDRAFVAGLLHDAGKWALQALSPEGAARAADRVQREGMFPLEAEERELGVDHALAGKWLAEAWGLPQDYAAAIWLHHHPVGAVDETENPIGLIDLVALSNALARQCEDGRAGEHPASILDLRIQRLGLTREEVSAAMTECAAQVAGEEAPPKPAGISGAASASAPYLRLERRAARLEAMAEASAACGLDAGLDTVIDVYAKALRAAFSVSAGFCGVMDEDNGVLLGRLWRGPEAALEPLRVPMGAGEEESGGGSVLLRALKELILAPQGGAWRDQGLVVAPIMAGERRIGQIVFDGDASELGGAEADYQDLLRFGGAFGQAVLRCRRAAAQSAESEHLAAALWKGEIAFQKRMRAERLAIIGRMSAGAAHEINNPLAVVMGRAQMLLSKLTAPEEVKALEIIIEQGRRVTRILSDLMQFARPPKPRLQPAQVTAVLQHLATARRPFLAGLNIAVEESYEDDLPRVRLDRYQIEQVMLQIFLNAEQAMQRAGGTLRLTAAAGPARRSVIIRVEDTGPGMPPEVLEHCFEPFFTTRRPGDGTGLGLSICHGVIEAHGGSIAMHSIEGKGAAVTISLPAVAELAVLPGEPKEPKESEAAPPPPPSGEAEAARPPAILVVNHDEDLRHVLEETLKHRRYAAAGAEEGVEALAIIATRPIDLVLLDLDLPGQHGLTVLREIRQRHPGLPVIALASPGADCIEEARGAGARACFEKPFEMGRLLAEIQGALDSRHAA